jgi:Domain of unknown function (DUF6457)
MDTDQADPDDTWYERLTEALSGGSGRAAATLTPHQRGQVLRIARDVAHGTERKNAPVATFIAGRYVEARCAEGADAGTALNEVAEAVGRLLPDATP